MFKNEKGKEGPLSWITVTEEQPNGDTLCSICFKDKEGGQTGIFFRKRKGESMFSYDDLLVIEKFKEKNKTT